MARGTAVILNNYSRPETMPDIIRAWRDQSLPPAAIIVTDNRPLNKQTGREGYPNGLCDTADECWRMTKNLGCPCHFYPALARYEFKYIMFADDDFIPGYSALQSLLRTAEELGGKFATIGQCDGARNFLLEMPEGKRYSGRSVPPYPKHIQGAAVKAHLTCRGHLVRQDLLYHFLPFRQAIVERFGEEGERLCGIHDDFLMCLGIQKGTGFPSYMQAKPQPAFLDQKLFAVNLDTPDDKTSLWKRVGHFEERNRMVDMALAVGWKPV